MPLSVLGGRLEVVDRELAFLDRDAQRKLEAFEKARTVRVLSSSERKPDGSLLAAELYYIFVSGMVLLVCFLPEGRFFICFYGIWDRLSFALGNRLVGGGGS